MGLRSKSQKAVQQSYQSYSIIASVIRKMG